jgi:hypothetical protein
MDLLDKKAVTKNLQVHAIAGKQKEVKMNKKASSIRFIKSNLELAPCTLQLATCTLQILQ